MIKGKQTKLIETLYKNEIKYFAYEIYKGSLIIPHIKTYAVLDDSFDTLIKLEELGQINETLIEELKENGYKPLNIENKELKLKKTA